MQKGGRPPAYTYLVRDLHLDGVDAGDVDVCGHFFSHLKAQVSQDQLDMTLSQGSDLHMTTKQVGGIKGQLTI